MFRTRRGVTGPRVPHLSPDTVHSELSVEGHTLVWNTNVFRPPNPSSLPGHTPPLPLPRSPYHFTVLRFHCPCAGVHKRPSPSTTTTRRTDVRVHRPPDPVSRTTPNLPRTKRSRPLGTSLRVRYPPTERRGRECHVRSCDPTCAIRPSHSSRAHTRGNTRRRLPYKYTFCTSIRYDSCRKKIHSTELLSQHGCIPLGKLRHLSTVDHGRLHSG